MIKDIDIRRFFLFHSFFSIYPMDGRCASTQVTTVFFFHTIHSPTDLVYLRQYCHVYGCLKFSQTLPLSYKFDEVATQTSTAS